MIYSMRQRKCKPSNITGGASGMAFYCPGRSENSADAVAEGMGKAVECAPWAVFLG